MSEYLPSFIVEPVLRQARRFSRLSGTGEESPGFLPTVAVPDLQRWSPARFWNTSPPPSLEDPIIEGPSVENRETTVQSITRTIQLWANQLNSFDSIPSPPLEAMEDIQSGTAREQLGIHQDPSTTEFPLLETEVAQQPPPLQRPAVLQQLRTSSETSLNPAHELSYQSRLRERPHATSDPIAAPHSDLALTRRIHGDSNVDGPRRREGSGALPEDDGMGALRQKISAIWSGKGTPAEKSRRVHLLMVERYQKGRDYERERLRLGSPISTKSSAPGQDASWNLTPEDLKPTYAPRPTINEDDLMASSTDSLPPPALGCQHYHRNVKMQCATCSQWYPCRLCHDEDPANSDHSLPRRETKHMLCMLCLTPQGVSQFCKKCGEQAAHYYCAICKLWNNDPNKSVYHCDDCGICRLGEGLGKDFFHCKTCAACMSIAAESTHKCIERSTKSDCPICGEYMFTSNKAVAFMRCGHSIHEKCFHEWCNASYKCPICSKSIANMESQFRRLDRHIEEQPMPEEYRGNRAYVFCNDCNSRCVTAYHWLGLKCRVCDSYNTTQLELLGAEGTPRLQQQEQQAQVMAGHSEATLTASQINTPTGETGTEPMDIPRSAVQAQAMAAGTPSGAAYLLPHSPTQRPARSPSPIIGSYFGTGQRAATTTPGSPATPVSSNMAPPRRGTTPLDDDDDLDFWGRPNSPRAEATVDSEEESSSDEDETMEDDDGEDEDDMMDLIGHR
jgi:hypothetical protein